MTFRQLEWGLLGVWAAVLVSAFAYGKYNADRTRHDVRSLLMATSALLVVMAALFWQAGARGTPLSAFSLLVSLGMAASFVGDLILAEYIRTPQRVIFGILAFGVAHVAYIGGLLSAAGALDGGLDAAGWAIVGGLVVLGVVLWRAIVQSAKAPAALNYASLGYTGLISAMTGLGVALALAEPRLWPLALGTVLFFASDAILGNQILRKHNWFLVNDVVWVLYISGQALIVWSNRVALNLPG